MNKKPAVKSPEELEAEVMDLFEKSKGQAGWAVLQNGFMEMIDDYVEVELSKDPDHDINNHEAGGQWRIGFPHQAIRGDSRVGEYMKATMEARIKHDRASLYHGYSDCAEVHHEIETYIYFQIPLLYWDLIGSELALESIEHLAHHMGNWEKGVPDWYDWDKHEFVSAWLGTKFVRDYPPYDYQEANHFRWIDAVMAAYLGTGEKRYLDLIVDYTNHWCDHIEALAEAGKPIRCSIVPEGAKTAEMGSVDPNAGADAKADEVVYRTFYSGVGSNTSYDVAGAIMDLYRVTGNRRYLRATRSIIDQFFENGAEGIPAGGYNFRNAAWSVGGSEYLARLALQHDLITGENRYGQKTIDWACSAIDRDAAIDKSTFKQGITGIPSLMIAAHYYDGNPGWLKRAYAQAFITYAATENEDIFSQCGGGRQGSKFHMELLYQPLLGGANWGTRGNIPLLRLQHQTSLRQALPEDVAFRIWRIDESTEGFEAVNLSHRSVSWSLEGASAEQYLIRIESEGKVEDGKLEIAPNDSISGCLVWTPVGAGIKPGK